MGERRRALRPLAVLVVVAFAAVLLIGTRSPTSSASTTFSFSRLQGTDRYDTARAVAEQTFTTSADVILATGEKFPDALAGGYVAGVGQVPILLTATNSLPAATQQGLKDLKTVGIVILGGPNAVSTDVESQLNRDGYKTSRIAGSDRYDTAKRIAESSSSSPPGSYQGAPTAIIASGDDAHFPDALAASPMAYADHFPTLLTTIDSLAPAARQGLTDLAIKHVIIAGGTAAVSDNVASQIQQMGISVQRLSGADRTETAAKIADFELAQLAFKTAHVNMARGDAFPDALTGGVHAGQEGPAPVLLTASPDQLGSPTATWLATNAQPLNDGHIFGGTAAVSSTTQANAEAIVRYYSKPTCGPASTTTSSTAGATTTSSAPTTTSTSAPTTTSTTAATTTTTCPPASSSTTTSSSTTSSSTTSTSTSSTSTPTSTTLLPCPAGLPKCV